LGAESSRIEMKLEPDPRLVAAVGGAVSHVAERVGLDPKAQADFAKAAEEACRQALPSLVADEAMLDVIVEKFPDRIEVTLSPVAPVPQTQRETSAGARREPSSRGGPRNNARRKGVDRVVFATNGGTSRLTLIKYVGSRPREL